MLRRSLGREASAKSWRQFADAARKACAKEESYVMRGQRAEGRGQSRVLGHPFWVGRAAGGLSRGGHGLTEVC